MIELTAEQKKAVKIMKSGDNCFITGKAGTGKTTVIKSYLNQLSDAKKYKILRCAPTGIASILINGITLHKAFKIPLQPVDNKSVSKKEDLELIDAAEIIIIDEISMCRGDIFTHVYNCINLFEEKKQIIVVGDFFQLPPVAKKEDIDTLFKIWSYVPLYAFESPGWKKLNFKMVSLEKVMRQTDINYIDALNQVRVGDSTGLIFFNSLEKKFENDENIITLCPKNSTADTINENAIEKIKTKKEKIYNAVIKGYVPDLPTKKELHIKEGCRIITIANSEYFVNGMTGTVKKIEQNSIEVKFDDGTTRTVDPYTWETYTFSVSKDKKIVKTQIGSFTQLPIKIAYAISIHKSQGQTYERVKIMPEMFTHGQLYVALSRAKTSAGIYLQKDFTEKDLITDQRVINFYNNCKNSVDDVDDEDLETAACRKKNNSKRRGRPRGTKTVVMRVPEILKDEILQFISNRMKAEADTL